MTPVLLIIAIFLCIAVSVMTIAIALSWTELAAQWVTAVGTWVGGIFTGSAFLFTAYQLNFDARVHHAEKNRRINDIREVAKSCAFRISYGKPQKIEGGASGFKSVEIKFNNRTTHNVQDISVEFDGREVAHADQNNAGANPWVQKIDVTEFPEITQKSELVTWNGAMSKEHTEKLIRELRDRLNFYYTIDGLRFRRIGEKVKLL